MPDERTPGAPPAAPPAAPVASPTATPPAAPPGPVPYDRFSQVVQERNAIQQEKARLEGQLQQAQQIVQTAQGIINQQQQRPAPAAPPATPAPNDDPWEETLQRQLGTDEAGLEARKVLDNHAEYVARKKGYITKEEAIQIAQQIAQQGNNKITTAFQITNEFQGMVARGVVTPEEAQGLQRELNGVLAQNPELSTQPHNVSYLSDSIFARAVKDGRIRPYSQPAPVNPMQFSGPASAPDPNAPLPPINPSTLGFKTLKAMSAEKLQKLTDRSMRAHQGATS